MKVLQTPDERFSGLPGYDFSPHYVEVASGDAWGWVGGKADYANPAALKKLVAQGAILRPFPQPVRDLARQVS